MAIGKSRRDVDGGAELSFRQRVWCVVGSLFRIHCLGWAEKIDVGNGVLAYGKQAIQASQQRAYYTSKTGPRGTDETSRNLGGYWDREVGVVGRIDGLEG